MSFNRKYRDPVSVRPTARLVCATNAVPRFSDKSDGIWRRLIILPCDVVIPESEQDKDLPQKMQAELPGIFNWALKGAGALRSRGWFAIPTACKRSVENHRHESSSARRFLTDYCELDVDGQIATELLYGHYKEWCRGRSEPPLSDSQFGSELLGVFPNVKKRRPQTDGARVSTYCGISMTQVPYVDPPDDKLFSDAVN